MLYLEDNNTSDLTSKHLSNLKEKYKHLQESTECHSSQETLLFNIGRQTTLKMVTSTFLPAPLHTETLIICLIKGKTTNPNPSIKEHKNIELIRVATVRCISNLQRPIAGTMAMANPNLTDPIYIHQRNQNHR